EEHAQPHPAFRAGAPAKTRLRARGVRSCTQFSACSRRFERLRPISESSANGDLSGGGRIVVEGRADPNIHAAPGHFEGQSAVDVRDFAAQWDASFSSPLSGKVPNINSTLTLRV